MPKLDVSAVIRQVTVWFVGIVALGAVIVSSVVQANEPRDDDQWKEEILVQLSELRKSEGDLRQQVVDLQAKVQALESAGRSKPVSLDLRDQAYPVFGNRDARVAMVEFSDFQCPFCRHYQQTTMPTITNKYVTTGKMKYVFVNYPLSFHEHAEPAAIAGMCAQRQDAFWKMRGLLFENQATLGADAFATMAASLKLNSAKFDECLQDPKVVTQIHEQAQLGQSVGVNGTPAFLIGRVKDGVMTDGKLVNGAQPLENFERVIDPLLTGAAAQR